MHDNAKLEQDPLAGKPRAAVVTHGCRYNQFESAEICQQLQNEGFEMVPASQKADLYVVNTCTVTEKSDSKSRQSIRKVSSRNRDAAIVVTGCYSQINPDEVLERTHADLVIGNREKSSIVRHLKKAGLWSEGSLQKKSGPARAYVKNPSRTTPFPAPLVRKIPGRTKAILKVQTGCNAHCSFCVVTIARGNSISEDPERVLENFKILVRNGFKEITLTGIHLGSFGRDLSPGMTLCGLLERLVRLEGDFRIRLSSLGPMEIDESLIHLMRESEKICPSLHLPLQSGADAILRSMRRNYTSRQYREVMQNILSHVADVGIGGDVMTGFPGETEDRFRQTVAFIESLPFAYLHVFSFSERPGTVAPSLPDKVAKNVRRRRSEALKALGLRKSREFRERSLGSEREVLVEEQRDRETGSLKGHTDNYIPVLMEGGDDRKNRLARVRLTRIEGLKVFGEFTTMLTS